MEQKVVRICVTIQDDYFGIVVIEKAVKKLNEEGWIVIGVIPLRFMASFRLGKEVNPPLELMSVALLCTKS